MTLIIIVVILLGLFGLAFATKRRFGVLGLALAAGVVLAQNASGYLAEFFVKQQFPVAPLNYSSAAVIVITLLPALVLLAGGPTYSSKRAALIGASGFALLGTYFVLGPLTTALPVEDPAMRNALVVIANMQNVIVVLALVIALADTFLVHGISKRPHHNRDKH